MRFVSVQLEAFIANDLWLRNARHANAMAQRVRAALTRPGGPANLGPFAASAERMVRWRA